MGTLLFILFTFSFYTSVNAGSGTHSLWYLATYITGETPFPEFTVVLMLDDIQVAYYDSNNDQFPQDGHEDEINSISQDNVHVFRTMSKVMSVRSSALQLYYNATEGVHVQQKMAGCEMKDDGDPSFILTRDTFDGIVADGLSFNITHYTYYNGEPGVKSKDICMLCCLQLQHIYLPICMRTMKTYLERDKSLVLRIVRPRVRLIQIAVPGGVKVSCLAFGFYPRHINLTLLRDGEPIADQELTGGEVLPNGDRTYQMRKTLEVSTEELREKHNYTCTAAHLSLDNKLDVSWVPELGGIREGRFSLLVPLMMVVMVVICCVICLLCVYICIKRKCSTDRPKTSSQLSSVDDMSEQISLSEESEN